VLNARLYGGQFQDAMNALYSSENIQNTANRVKELEAQLNTPFTPGKFNRFLLDQTVLPTNFSFDKFEQDFATIPQYLRDRVGDVMRTNFHSQDPLPVLAKVSENVDQTHDVVIKTFEHNGRVYIGILYLCPNSRQPP
jgi:hypothetical protein